MFAGLDRRCDVFCVVRWCRVAVVNPPRHARTVRRRGPRVTAAGGEKTLNAVTYPHLVERTVSGNGQPGAT